MAIAPSKLGSLIANHSQTNHALVQRLRELELVIDEASDEDLLATLTRARDEHAALPPNSQRFNSPWERVRVFLKPYLTEKGRTWAEPLKSLHVPDEEDVPYGRRQTRLVLPQVPADEAAPFYAQFLAAFPDGRVGEHLDAQVGQLDALCGLLQWRAAFRYEEGKWTVNEVIGHLLDTERVWAYRLLRIARGDGTVLAGFDENVYTPEGEFNTRPMIDLVLEFVLLRSSTLALVNGIPADAWSRVGTANGHRTSARAIVYIILGHTKHHFDVLKERYRLPNVT